MFPFWYDLSYLADCVQKHIYRFSRFCSPVFSYRVGLRLVEQFTTSYISFGGLLHIKGFLAARNKQWNSQFVSLCSFLPSLLLYSPENPDNNSNSWFCETNMEGDS